MANKMKVWPGPVVMVPMATDILLVGTPDLPSGGPNTGVPLTSTKLDYSQVFLPGIAEPQPFNVVNSNNHLQPGAHVMWTLPYSLRRSSQDPQTGELNFPLVPNRWLITRFEYSDITNGSAPNVVCNVVISDDLSSSAYPPPYNQGQYPQGTGQGLPYQNIGKCVPLAEFSGETSAGASFLNAAGPGSVAWAVSYDNIRNVFGFYDNALSNNATPQKPYYYTYYIVGWYSSPEDDLLFNINTGDNSAWQSQLQQEFMWSLGDSSTALTDALAAWSAWQQAHGLNGNFDPNQLNLPPQAKAAIIAWYNWQQANGETATQPNLARQTLCHSMVSTVQWQGQNIAYGTGSPLSPGTYPTISMGNNSVEAISIYMANQIVNDPGNTQPVENIPILERALEAFQQDLLYEYGTDPILVENLLHNATFSKVSAGNEWIVTGATSSNTSPSSSTGAQKIALDAVQTQTLTQLNALQSQLNDLLNKIATQQAELYLLDYKLNLIAGGTRLPQSVVTQVNQSYQAIKAELTSNLSFQQNLETTVSQKSQTLQQQLGAEYELKTVVTPHYYAPNDPVIMVAGASLDTKLSPSIVNLDNGVLEVRYTGQFVAGIAVTYNVNGTNQTQTIAATDILNKITFPAWNAFPKEVMDLWVEACILDTNAASLLAAIFFEKCGASQPSLPALTQIIQTNQTLIWNDGNELDIPSQVLVEMAGMTGIPPAPAGVAFRKKQPWTPVFMDYSVAWFPTSSDPAGAFADWSLEELDYNWSGNSIASQAADTFNGRTLINPSVAQNIQLKINSFQTDPNYDNLPEFIKQDLQLAANLIPYLDIVTQPITGFTDRILTRQIAMSQPSQPDTNSLLSDGSERNVPIPVGNGPNNAPNYNPIRSGHFQLLNVWIVDSFGQIQKGANVPLDQPAINPLTNVLWSESLTTPGSNWGNKFAQLAPRLSQGARADLNLLQSDDDSIISNSSDATSPICGWVMPNHLDNSLMVYDAAGNNLGSIIKVQSEQTTSNNSIRWDAAPGLNTVLGAPPQISNEHLLNFVNGLLATRFAGSDAYDDLMAAIDSALWTASNFAGQDGNLSLLLGRPMAVVRAETLLTLSGNPAYNQDWNATGQYYNNNGQYQATNPPFMSVPFSLRIGDAYMVENGVMGYFQDDLYDTFYPVYGANGQTATIIEILRAGQSLDFVPPIPQNGFKSSYVKPGHLVSLPPDGSTVKLTLLVDPIGSIPIFPGSLPYSSVSLPNGPVSEALKNLQASFRVGPILLDPATIKMPTPTEIKGNWSWMARKTVSAWDPETTITPYSPLATLNPDTLHLMEGWLNLSDFESKNN